MSISDFYSSNFGGNTYTLHSTVKRISYREIHSLTGGQYSMGLVLNVRVLEFGDWRTLYSQKTSPTALFNLDE